ncbi:MAG: LemA family protein [Gemmatimonadaceae bacterium]|nr:LemA family protein [Gemmatimonadaceae bacterium]
MSARTLLRRLLPVVLFAPVLTGCGYNTIQSYDEAAAAAKQQIEVQLQRRADLVPNLVSTVQGFAAQEQAVFGKVAEARSTLLTAVKGGDVTQMAEANQALTGSLGRLLAIAESYPTLKSDANFLRLQDELTGTENRIAVARTDYNEAVQRYNTYIRKFPAVLTAKATGAKERVYFEVANAAAREAPKVEFPAAKP